MEPLQNERSCLQNNCYGVEVMFLRVLANMMARARTPPTTATTFHTLALVASRCAAAKSPHAQFVFTCNDNKKKKSHKLNLNFIMDLTVL